MQRDMGTGTFAYALEGVPKGQRPPQVQIFDPCSCDLAVTVEEQCK
jgi:hypothetical protein